MHLPVPRASVQELKGDGLRLLTSSVYEDMYPVELRSDRRARGGCTEERRHSSLSIFFPRDFVEAPSEKLPDGRPYHEFFHEGAQEFCIDIPPILVTFWSPGVLLATLGASLGPRPQFLMTISAELTS